MADINRDKVQEAANAIGNKAEAVRLDVTKAEDVQNLVDQVVAAHGRLDYIFNNAGFLLGGLLLDMKISDWNSILDVNLKGVIHGVQAAYPVMVKQGSGHIVNTASLAGLIGYPALGAYSTTKFAVVGFTNNLRTEAAKLGVKVTAICPGFIQTGLFINGKFEGQNKETLQSIIPIKYVPIEVAVEKILEGVRRNKAVIIFPFYAKLLWWAQRLCPPLVDLVNQKFMGDYRKRERKNKK
jgi:NADP-dependent 3-hydroxy acid dehydrogenase YdfG